MPAERRVTPCRGWWVDKRVARRSRLCACSDLRQRMSSKPKSSAGKPQAAKAAHEVHGRTLLQQCIGIELRSAHIGVSAVDHDLNGGKRIAYEAEQTVSA